MLKYTMDIKVRNKILGQKTWKMLKEIIRKGITFLHEKKEEAMRALLERLKKKVWSY